MALHEIKIVSPFYEAVRDGTKTFEIRKNDRNYEAGDEVVLMHWNKDEERLLAGSPIMGATVGYITDFRQASGYVAFSLLHVKDII